MKFSRIIFLALLVIILFSYLPTNFALTPLPFYDSFEGTHIESGGWLNGVYTSPPVISPSNCPNLPASSTDYANASITNTLFHTGSQSALMIPLEAGESGISAYGSNFYQNFSFIADNVVTAWIYPKQLINQTSANIIYQVMTMCGNQAGTYWYVQLEYCLSCDGGTYNNHWIWTFMADPVDCKAFVNIASWNNVTVTEIGATQATFLVNGVSVCTESGITTGHDDYLSFGEVGSTGATCSSNCANMTLAIDDVCINEANCPPIPFVTVTATHTITGFLVPNFVNGVNSFSWLYFMIVVLVPMGEIVGVITMDKNRSLDRHSLIFIFLGLLLLDSIFGVMLNVVTVAMPFVFGILFIVYLWRGRG